MAVVPEHEVARLNALRDYRVLDTAAEAAYDDLTQVAAFVCDTPIALVSLIDVDRQWFKSKVGITASETPRDMAFCAHTILDQIPLIVEDTSKDIRFAANPLVTGDPLIRFYAGAPLITPEGHALGTLCAIDRVPRRLTLAQTVALSALARQVVAQLELRRVSASLAGALKNVRTLSAMLPMCAWCRKVRDDAGFWSLVEDYLSQHGGPKMTHGICPACLKIEFPVRPVG